MRKFLLILIINFLIYSTDSLAKQKILTIAMVNNALITDIDIKNEIYLTKITFLMLGFIDLIQLVIQLLTILMLMLKVLELIVLTK